MIRPAQLARHVGTLPALALLLAAALPLAGDALRPGLGGFVALVSFACIGAMNATPPNRREAVAALMMAAIPWATCLLTLAAMLAIRLPPDLALAAALIATSPVALGTAARCHQIGLEGRPAIWAALLGMAMAPLLLPLMAAAAAAGAAGPPGTVLGLHSPWVLAERALLVGALPALLGFVLRRSAPRTMAALAPDLRGLVVLGLAGLGLCGGATLARSLPTFTWDAVAIPLAIAVVVQAMALAVAWVMASGAGRHASTTRLRGLLTLAAASRNASFAWAAAMGLLTPRAEAVLAFSLAGTFFLPALFLLWHGHRTRRAAAGKACQKA